jgi:tetratricopeptide (TPR) repeat protein
LLLLAKILVALKNVKEAKEMLFRLLSNADNGASNIIAAIEGQDILTALENESLKAGSKIPLLPVVPTATPVASQKAPAIATAEQVHKKDFESGKTPSADTSAIISSSTTTTIAASPPTSSTISPSATTPSSFSSPVAQIEPMNRLLTMTDPTSAVHIAVNLVNDGKNAEAIAMLDLLMNTHGPSVAPLATRGTARALEGDLTGAVEDFNAAIIEAPNEADFYKRRAQALGALGRDQEALEDLLKAREFASNDLEASETLGEVARIHIKRRDYHRAELNLRAALELNPQATTLLPLLASCQVSQGDLAEGAAMYSSIIESGYNEVDAMINLGMAYKELCKVDEATIMLRRAATAGKGTIAEVNARRLIAQMLQGLGDHLGAVRELDAALKAALNEGQRVELRFLRGACYHAVGLHKLAIEDYITTLEANPQGLSPEAISFMCLAFYQKEMALWGRAHIDDPIECLCLDADLHPEFKELWCKKTPPGPEFVHMYRTIMQNQMPDWSAPRLNPSPAPSVLKELSTAADALGAQVQYRHQGFLPNRRQRRMAGFAAIEYAQMLVSAANARKQGKPLPSIPDTGSSACARGPSGIGGGGRGGSGTHFLGWRDAMELLVKWRQVAEPNDQVLWVDLLTEHEFSSGFGSHTPMFTGQTKCVRYYMNFERALNVAKQVALAQGKVYDAENKPVEFTEEKAVALSKATTAEEFWSAVGVDSWVVVPVQSTTRNGHSMEGTRLTVVNLALRQATQAAAQAEAAASGKNRGALDADQDGNIKKLNINGTPSSTTTPEKKRKDLGGQQKKLPQAIIDQEQPHSFEFSIRTPVTPARWVDYDEELTGVFETLIQALADGNQPDVADAALRFVYYWYNFMPLARGSALCGYVSLLGTFLAAEMPIRGNIPTSYQTDWEAILESSPEGFITSVGSWLLPPELRENKSGRVGEEKEVVPWPCASATELPQVKEVLATMRERLEALNGYQIF